MPATRRIALVLAAPVVALGGALFVRLSAAPPADVEMAGYATSLEGRTASQKYNAQLATQRLNGAVIPPGGIFSFNRRVRSWTIDEGYVKAPVSFDGELVRAFGGGVCQTSTTLYNTALLAGMQIVERHPHVFAPHYVPPGQDAAVAQTTVDLRFRNPNPWPVRVKASATDTTVDIRMLGSERPREQVQIVTDVLSRTPPGRYTRVTHAPGGRVGPYIRNPGSAGYRIVAYRVFVRGNMEVRRERLSDDSYDTMRRIISLNDEP